MSLTIELPDEVMARVRAAASQAGSDAEAYVASILAAHFAPTISPDYLDANRFRSLEDFVAEQRQKWNLPQTWPAGTEYKLTEEDQIAIEQISNEQQYAH
jgi:plasmid stability protein